jgi:hypothetical protein
VRGKEEPQGGGEAEPSCSRCKRFNTSGDRAGFFITGGFAFIGGLGLVSGLSGVPPLDSGLSKGGFGAGVGVWAGVGDGVNLSTGVGEGVNLS